jgi:acyl-coenzyme A synthetase/AMP-(fatty) acid ligase
VEVDGDYVRILGRDSDLINVGGHKVYPSEVEAAVLECTDVKDAVVYGAKSPITGSIVCADVVLRAPTDEVAARLRIKKHCASRLEPFMVPVRIKFVDTQLYSERMKRVRLRS